MLLYHNQQLADYLVQHKASDYETFRAIRKEQP